MTSVTIAKYPVEGLESWELADELGELQACIGQLKDRESQLKGELIDRGDPAVDGEYYGIKLVDVNRRQTNWRLIADKMGASRQIITAHSRNQSFTQVRTVALED